MDQTAVAGIGNIYRAEILFKVCSLLSAPAQPLKKVQQYCLLQPFLGCFDPSLPLNSASLHCSAARHAVHKPLVNIDIEHKHRT